MQVVHYISSFSLYVVSFYDNGPLLSLRNLDDLCPNVSFSLLTLSYARSNICNLHQQVLSSIEARGRGSLPSSVVRVGDSCLLA